MVGPTGPRTNRDIGKMINFKFLRLTCVHVVYLFHTVNVLVTDIILDNTIREHMIFALLHIDKRLFELFSKEVRVKKQPETPLTHWEIQRVLTSVSIPVKNQCIERCTRVPCNEQQTRTTMLQEATPIAWEWSAWSNGTSVCYEFQIVHQHCTWCSGTILYKGGFCNDGIYVLVLVKSVVH